MTLGASLSFAAGIQVTAAAGWSCVDADGRPVGAGIYLADFDAGGAQPIGIS